MAGRAGERSFARAFQVDVVAMRDFEDRQTDRRIDFMAGAIGIDENHLGHVAGVSLVALAWRSGQERSVSTWRPARAARMPRSMRRSANGRVMRSNSSAAARIARRLPLSAVASARATVFSISARSSALKS